MTLIRLAWFTLGWNVLVILWGAVVRATGSGAGCGAHWPTCNGEVIPPSPTVATLIEFSHRATSGVALLLVAALLYLVLRQLDRGHLARFWAIASMLLILSEAAIGAGLVLFQRVAGDTSTSRGYWISGHLINTFLLLAALVLAARFLSAPRWVKAPGLTAAIGATFGGSARGWPAILAVLALLATGISGAIAALGDTLFKATSLAAAIAQDFSPESHIFLRLRILHPFIALLGGGLILFLAYRMVVQNPMRPTVRRRGQWLGGLVIAQWFLGLVNIVLLAPTWLQIVHLLVADLIWMTLVLALADDSGPA
jgi:heme A synthase